MDNPMVAGPGVAPNAAVSARESEVLAALGEHLTNAEIAGRLFISIRTVESHVSSLLRKFGVDDRRALAALAAAPPWFPEGPAAQAAPVPVTSFVGRTAERAALNDALDAHRLITAVGPGGVGKTRLALSVVAERGDRFADGSYFVDLVPITDPSMVAAAVAAALGLGDYRGRSAEETLLDWLADRETLLVLDNCEHLLDGVPVLLERLLAGSPRLTVLVTSRARLLVPFEWVFPVPGLSVDVDGSDAVELFQLRAAAGGAVLGPTDRDGVAAICRGLDGMPLAIELAAARVASLGVDGVQAALADRLQLLAGGGRTDDRHRSLRSAFDWSYALLDEVEQAVLRRISVFVAPMTFGTVAASFGEWAPVAANAVPTVLARLAEQSLLIAMPGAAGTRYRTLETVRQYGADRLEEAGEATEAATRHMGWCLNAADALRGSREVGSGRWRGEFDDIADELRGALTWARRLPEPGDVAYRLALGLAELTFVRGLPTEAQTRYEQAAGLAPDDAAAARAWHFAAGAAECRHVGVDALWLHRAAADAAIRAGDLPGAAMDLARAAELIHRAPGLMATPPDAGLADALLREARALPIAGTAAEARVLAADALARADEDDDVVGDMERAITLARRVWDPLTESAALDQLTAVQLSRGDVRAGYASARRRIEVMTSLEITASSGLEFFDAFQMAADCAIGVGDLRASRGLAETLRDLPFNREEGHLAVARLIVVTALSGDWDETLALAERFRESWERAGRPRAGNLARGAYAAATVHGLCGDEESRVLWLDIAARLVTPGRPLSMQHIGEFLDATLLLHQGRAEEALRLLGPPEDLRNWYSGMWRPWYGALWAESAVLAGSDEAPERIRRAREVAIDNPIATAIVDRAAALAGETAGDRAGLHPAAAALEAAGCRYQWARTLVLIGGSDGARGEAVLAAMGATPMIVTPVPPG